MRTCLHSGQESHAHGGPDDVEDAGELLAERASTQRRHQAAAVHRASLRLLGQTTRQLSEQPAARVDATRCCSIDIERRKAEAGVGGDW